MNRLVKDWIIEYLNYLIGLLVFQEMLRTMIKSLESNKILVMPPRKILWLKETKPFRICHDLSGNCSVLKTEFKFFHYFLNLNCEIEKQALVQISVILWLYNWGCPYQRSVMSEELTMQLMMINLNLSILRIIKNHVDSFLISEAVSQVLTKMNRNAFKLLFPAISYGFAINQIQGVY